MSEIVHFLDRQSRQHIVLLVDDEYLMRGVLAEILRDAGFFVVIAISGEQAISYLNKLTHIDVVFSDIKMPGMGGFALAKWISINRPEVPIILATGYGAKTSVAHELSCVHLMSKPFGFDEIIAKINEVVRRERKLSS